MRPLYTLNRRVLCAALLLSMLCLQSVKAENKNLVPDTPLPGLDYFCTCNAQHFADGYQKDFDAHVNEMHEANLFGKEKYQGWVREFYPDARADLIFLLDDTWDIPPKGLRQDPLHGSCELNLGKFPSYTGTPTERLAKLTRDVKAQGWAGLGLWICNSRPNVDSLPVDSDTYWSERIVWSQQAGVAYWKVDWGIGMAGKPIWKFSLTPRVRATAPDVWIEFASGLQSDIYRTYDTNIVVSIPATIKKIGAFLAKDDPKDRRIINCEDEVYIGAATGCHYGVMRHPMTGPMINGKLDPFFIDSFRDVKRRMDEVTRAVRWHRIAPPFPKGDAATIDSVMLTDRGKTAPARITRGGLPLPTVTMPDGSKEPPYVLCSRHPDGEIAIATIPRDLGEIKGAHKMFFPLADVTIETGKLDRPVGVFGEYASLTLNSTADLAGKRILAQDLAGKTPVDITAEVKFTGGKLTIPGSVIHRVGLMAAKPGDVSDPGLVLAVEGLTRFVPKKPMKPGMYMSPPSSPTSAAAAESRSGQKLAAGTPARLRLTADKATLPDDGTECHLTITILDAAGRPISNSVQGKLEITSGKGMFPTGASFDFNTRNGQDVIEFRSYEQGKVKFTAHSQGIEPATFEITIVSSTNAKRPANAK
jgi:hypothetical protein